MGRIKSLASDTMIYGVFTVIGRFLTFLLTPIYTNYLPIVAVGDISYFFSIIAFINIIYAFGMETAFFRFYDEDDLAKSKKVFTAAYVTILAVAFISSTLVFIFAGKIAPAMSELPDAVKLVRLAAFLPLLDSMLVIPLAMLRMTRKAKRFALIRFFIVVIAVTLNMVFIISLKMGVEGVFLAQIISSLAGILLLSKDIIKNLIGRLDKILLKQMLRFGLPTVPATLSGMILQVVNIPILRQLTNPETVALFAVNNRLAIPMLLFVSVFIYAWKPFYMSRFKDADAKQLFSRVFTYFTLSASVIFLFVAFFIKFIVTVPFIGGTFIDKAYWSGLGIVPIVLTGHFLNGVFNNFAAGFHITKKTDYLPLAIGVAAVLNIILNFLLIPYLQIWGSALASLISYFVASVILYIISRKIYYIKYDWKRVITLIVLTAVFYLSGDYLTTGLSVGKEIIIKFIFLVGFVATLFLTKFFTKSELRAFMAMFRKRN
jgi:O-antigen/teichoic acid export membrane protein